MKKSTLPLIIFTTLAVSSLAQADTRTANAIASWDAKAIKDTTSTLVVTPLKSLTFNFAEGIGGFSTQDGAFDITIAGQSGATDFKLTSKLISNTLARASDNSVLTVGAKWNAVDLTNTDETVMIDATKKISAGLESLAQPSAYAGSKRTSAQSAFTFHITKATMEDKDVKFKELTDGYWNGNVAVQFTASWEGTFVPAP